MTTEAAGRSPSLTASPPEAGPIPGVAAIVLAAGQGKRMRSKHAKMVHALAGRPVVAYAVELADALAGEGVVVVVGHQGDRVKAALDDRLSRNGRRPPLRLVTQREQRGTGHAVLQTRPLFQTRGDRTPAAYLIVNGDTPLLTAGTVRSLYRAHVRQRATVTLLTAVVDDPTGYGRIVRETVNRSAAALAESPVLRVVEDRDASDAEARVREINAGTYLVDGAFLFDALERIEPKNTQREYYLTDLVALAVGEGRRVAAVTLADPEEGLGINSRAELAQADRVLRLRLARQWMDAGVTMYDPHSVRIDADVIIGADTILHPCVTLEGGTRIGDDCTIRSHVRLTDCRLGDRVVVQESCVMTEATLEDDVVVGPFAHLRPGAVVRRRGKVGNFVEMKQAELGEGAKANHLTYLGDTRVGKRVNIGAGTVTCNYDGRTKHLTVIEDDVFLGSDAILVAPVTIGRGALVAAGSTLTQDVPPDALAIARASQVNRPGWAARRRALQEEAGPGARGPRQAAGAKAARQARPALPGKKGSKAKARRQKKSRKN